MPTTATTEYITKTEAARVYRRSERSISRDITNAVKFGDRRVLQHVELRLEDGKRRPGTELTIEEIVELRDRGLNPTWLLDTTWLRTTYGRRDEPPQAGNPIIPEITEPVVAEPSLPDDLAKRAAVLAAQNDALRQSNADLRTQAERLEKELDRRAQERSEENELQKQNNVLMQQVYNLLSRMQESTGEVSILPAPRVSSVRDAEEPASVEANSSRKGTERPTPAASQSASRKRPAKRARKAQAESKAAPNETPTAMKKYLPTLDRVVHSLFRK